MNQFRRNKKIINKSMSICVWNSVSYQYTLFHSNIIARSKNIEQILIKIKTIILAQKITL